MENTDKRVAIVGIIVENLDKASEINAILHEYSEFIIGRMGIPYREKHLSIMSIAIDAPNNVINALTGRIGRLEGVFAKATYSTYNKK
ncbi:MAG: iron-only hydrogenase system regulator [Clostridioides sp.]|jgi:putative iron-only hydrogenase system regulator|nr:iron-only hydrogenase system regulator [Clostridioides sp.]